MHSHTEEETWRCLSGLKLPPHNYTILLLYWNYHYMTICIYNYMLKSRYIGSEELIGLKRFCFSSRDITISVEYKERPEDT